MRATLKNYRQSPRKVRLVADALRGETVDRALVVLAHLPKKASLPMKKLLNSAVANAGERGVARRDLRVKNITVNQGVVFKRWEPRARGRAAPIRKRTSHVSVELAQQNAPAQSSNRS